MCLTAWSDSSALYRWELKHSLRQSECWERLLCGRRTEQWAALFVKSEMVWCRCTLRSLSLETKRGHVITVIKTGDLVYSRPQAEPYDYLSRLDLARSLGVLTLNYSGHAKGWRLTSMLTTVQPIRYLTISYRMDRLLWLAYYQLTLCLSWMWCWQ